MICFGPAYYKKVEGPSTDPIFGEGAAGFYGKPIPISCGTRRLTGVCLWASDFRNFTRKLIGGKYAIPDLQYYRDHPEFIIDLTDGISLGPFCDFAVGFGYRGDNISENFKTITVERIWANDILIFDRAMDVAVAYDGKAQDEKISMFPVDFTVYPGSEEQMPDPTIKEVEGENTPAFKGMVYVVFRDYDISKTGGGVPNIRIQFADRAGDKNAWAKFSKTQEDEGSFSPGIIQANWAKNQFTIWTKTQAVTYNMVTLKEVKRVDLDPELLPLVDAGSINQNSIYTFEVEGNRRTVFTDAMASFARPVYLVDFENGAFINKIGWHDGQRPSNANYPYIPGVQSFALVDPTYELRNQTATDYTLIAVGGSFGGNNIQSIRYDFYRDRIEYLWGREINTVPGGNIESVSNAGSTGVRGNGWSEFYFGAGNLLYWGFAEINADGRFFEEDKGSAVEKPKGIDWTVLCNLNTLEGLQRPGVTFTIKRIWIDPSDSNIVIWYNASDIKSCILKLYSDEYLAGEVSSRLPGQLIWNIETVPYGSGVIGIGTIPEAQKNQLNSRGSLIAWYIGNRYYEIDTMAGKGRAKDATSGIIKNGDSYIGFPAEQAGSIADPALYGIITARFAAGGPVNELVEYSPTRILLERSFNDRVPLDGLLRWFCRASGYTNNQIITNGINEQITGAIITQRVNLDDLLRECAGFFGFDKFESGGKIALTRSAIGDSYDVNFTVPEGRLAELGGEGDGKYLYTEIRDENDIPSGVELRYLDETADYNIGLQVAQRTKYPVATTDSVAFAKFSVPVIMKPGEALTYANRRLWTFNQERFYQQFRLPWEFMAVEPSDIGELLKSGFEYALKVFEVMHNGDYTVSVSAKRLALTVDKDYIAPEPIRPPLTAIDNGFMYPVVLDVPGLQSDIEGIPVGYVVSPQEINNRYTPSRVYIEDNGEFKDAGPAPSPVAQGICITRLNDSDTDVSFRMMAGRPTEFVDQTDEEALGGSTLVAIGAPNRWELLSWRTVTYDEGSKILTLGGLIRGFSGTDIYSDQHRSNDRVVLFDVNRISVKVFDVEDINGRVRFKAAANLIDLPFAPTVPLRITGSAYAPFAPSTFTAKYSGGDILLDWNRRDRLFNDNLDDGTDTIGNAEGFEAYRLRIYDANGELVREIDDLEDSEYIYAAADIATDLGSMPTVITASVCQRGATISYGLENTRTMAIYS